MSLDAGAATLRARMLRDALHAAGWELRVHKTSGGRYGHYATVEDEADYVSAVVGLLRLGFCLAEREPAPPQPDACEPPITQSGPYPRLLR